MNSSSSMSISSATIRYGREGRRPRSLSPARTPRIPGLPGRHRPEGRKRGRLGRELAVGRHQRHHDLSAALRVRRQSRRRVLSRSQSRPDLGFDLSVDTAAVARRRLDRHLDGRRHGWRRDHSPALQRGRHPVPRRRGSQRPMSSRIPPSVSQSDGSEGWRLGHRLVGFPDLRRSEIYRQAAAFLPDGTAMDVESVNNTAAQHHINPDLQALPDGGWIVTWSATHGRLRRRRPAAALRRKRQQGRRRGHRQHDHGGRQYRACRRGARGRLLGRRVVVDSLNETADERRHLISSGNVHTITRKR